MNPKVSIITTFYNSVILGDFVHKAMASLLSQTYKNIEFICVHDGSPDQTLEQLEYYQKKDSRIIIVDKKNEGTAQYAKAAGQDVATGEYIMLFDHDDELSLDAVEKAVNTFMKYPELDMISFIVKVVYSNGKLREICLLDERISCENEFRFKTITGNEALKKTVGRYDLHFRGFYRRNLFQKVSFRFTKKLVNADEIVERHLLEYANKIGICNGIYTHYIFSNSSAKSFNLKKLDILETDIYLRDYFKKLDIYSSRENIFEVTAYKNLVNGLKAYIYYRHTLSKHQVTYYTTLLKQSFGMLNKEIILNSYKGIPKIYNTILLLNYRIIYTFYKVKKMIKLS